MKRIRIFIADDHAILREGLVYFLQKIPQYEVVGESADGRDALERIEQLKPDIAILDISMPSMTGVEVTRQLKKYHPEIKVIILSQHDNEEYIRQALKSGVLGYLLKENSGKDLLRAVEEVMKNNVFLSPGIAKKVVTGFSDEHGFTHESGDSHPFNELSPRELEILKLIAEGKSNIQIGSMLFISDKTVNVHRANIMKKLNIHKIADLVKYAFKNGLVE
jgi:DNA-binding NarL/FixJ family response regulator